jgi:hypothetical protein
VVLPLPTVAAPLVPGDGGTDSISPASWGETDSGSGSPGTSGWLASATGVPTAPSTRPVGRNDAPTTTATASAATAVAPSASGRRGLRRCWLTPAAESPAADPAADPAAAFATAAPHPGHDPADRDQQRSQAKTPQEAHIRRPTLVSVDTPPTRFPQRSQYGSGEPARRGGRGSCAGGRAGKGSGSRPGNTGAGQAPETAAATVPGGAPPMSCIGR